ncbi:MAG: antibiotic biosynthesis monooxygenase family protein [Motilibacteraceae bacterium]
MTHPAVHSTGSSSSGVGSFVSVSHVTVDVARGEDGAGADEARADEVRADEVLERAFTDRLGEVEGEAGFQRLEVWRDVKRAGTYVMVTWWDSEADFGAYLRSDAHDRSHARVPTSPVRPRGAGLDRYQVIAR